MFSESSINWCELDYIKSEYIAEYWNTITGIFLCFSSLYTFYGNYKKNVIELYYSNILLFIVGIGTMMFHGTLIYFWQLLDEIPMMLIVIEYYKLLSVEIHLTNYIKFYRINYVLMYHIIPIIIASYYIHHQLQVFLFQGSLAFFILLVVYTFYKTNKQLNRLFYDKNKFEYVECFREKIEDIESEAELCCAHKHKYKSKKPFRKSVHSSTMNNSVDITNSFSEFKKYAKLRRYMKYHNYQGIFMLFLSLLIWNLDNHYCQHYIELHAIWHITTSIGMYNCNEIMKSYILLSKQLVQK